MPRTTWVCLALVAASACGVGCGPPPFYAGDPKTAADYYLAGDKLIENCYFTRDATTTNLVEAPPNQPWRQLADVTSQATNEAQVIADLKNAGARLGADMVLRLAAGAGAQVTTRSGGDFNISVRGVQLGGSNESTETSTRYHGLGTAIRVAQPGTEAYLGVRALTYSPLGAARFGSDAEGLLFTLTPYVTRVDGPAAEAGVQPGELIIGWQTARGTSTSTPCYLNESIQEAGPGATIDLYLWKPGERSELTVKLRKAKTQSWVVRARDVPEHGVQITVVRDGVRDGPDTLQAGDFVLDYARRDDFYNAAKPVDELTLRVRREGQARRVRVKLGTIPDSWYRVGNEPYVRPAGAPPPRARAVARGGEFGGVGLMLTTDQYGRIAVKQVFPGQPADTAGMRAGDILIAIDGQPMAGLKVPDVVARARGYVGTTVVIEVQRPGTADPLRFELTRARIRVPSSAPAP